LSLVGGLASLLLLAISVGAAEKNDHGIPHFAEVAPGIYRGGQPSPAGWAYLASLGVKYDVKLNTTNEGSDAEAARLGIAVKTFPIQLSEQTFSKPNRTNLWAAARSIQPHTFIHCSHGQDRTGLVVGIYRVTVLGQSKSAAYAEMREHGFHPVLRGLYRAWKDDVPEPAVPKK